MTIENEIKILDINIAELSQELISLGFLAHEQQKFRRYVYKSDSEQSWLRLRTDNVNTTITYKHFKKDSVDGMHELEVEVNDFKKAHELLLKIGMDVVSYQENRRKRFTLPGVEISIDEWPLIPPYIEIEASNIKDVEKYLEMLNRSKNKTTSEPTSYVYSLYGYQLDNLKHLVF